MQRASAPGYDLFKSIVTLILAGILIFLLLRGCSPAAAPTLPAATNVLEIAAAASQTPSPIPTTVAPSATPTPTTAPLPKPSPTSTPALADTPAPILTPTPEPVIITGPAASCKTILPSRLAVGQKAKALRNLNMRETPSISAALIQTNLAGTMVEIVDGPICQLQGNLAYLWWKIRLADGKEGWSAETPLTETAYFLEPAP
jgi:hypothetical protein